MSQPPAYTRLYSFTSWSVAYPSTPFSGVWLDAELNTAKATLDAILANLKLIQRDDGAVANDSVGLDQISNDALLTLGTNWTPRGAWATATAYAVGNIMSIAGSTYVCAIAHTSTVLATNIASGYWVLIFSTVGVTPSDGSVTTAKIVDGSVTTSKLGFTALDLTGTIRGQGGLAAGTATAGSYTVAGAASAGSPYLSIARATQAQGAVGLRLDGGTSGAVFEARQAASSNDLTIYNSGVLTNVMTFTAAGPVDAAYTLRATGGAAPLSGAGIEISYTAGVSYISSYDRTNTLSKPLVLLGSYVNFVANGNVVGQIEPNFAYFTGLQINGFNAGYLGAPLNPQAGAYTLLPSDCGKRLKLTNAGAQAITIAPFATQAIPNDDGVIIIVNDGTTTATIVPAGGVTLKFAGSSLTGVRMLAVNGVASLMKIGTDEWIITGAGIS